MMTNIQGTIVVMIRRPQHLRVVTSLLRRQPVVAILGPRQVGKTTLARQVFAAHKGPKVWFDLEDPRTAARFAEPMMALEPLRGLVVLDEIQHAPDVFRSLRVLADRPRTPCRFLILGSASPTLLRQSAESLAGRIAYHDLSGFSLGEVGGDALPRLWLRGGFPRSFLAPTDAVSLEWRRDFVRNLLERDLPQLGIGAPAPVMRRFWTMLAHYHGQTWNGSELARAFGVGDTTVRRYLDHLAAVFMVRILQPWHENLSKRQVKAPKVYIADTGLLHQLLDIRDSEQLHTHPKVGASWEGFALLETIRKVGAHPDECFFWGTYAGAELDLLVVRGKERLGFEIKRTETPSMTPSMKHALHDLKLDHLWVVHAGPDEFPLHEQTTAISLEKLVAGKSLG